MLKATRKFSIIMSDLRQYSTSRGQTFLRISVWKIWISTIYKNANTTKLATESMYTLKYKYIRRGLTGKSWSRDHNTPRIS